MITRLLLATAVTLLPIAAHADLVFLGQPDLAVSGFGNDHRLMDEHTPSSGAMESGFMTPTDVCNGDAVCTGSMGLKEETPFLAALGWSTGANVGLAFDPSQTGGTGLTLQTLGFTLFLGNTAVDSFGIDGPFTVTPAMVAMDHGLANGSLIFGLDAAQQLQFNADLVKYGVNLEVGAFGDWGCPAGAAPPPACWPANDGQDSLTGFTLPGDLAVPGPTLGGGLPGLAFAALGMIMLARRRNHAAMA
jgi:hypothetical protein